MTLVKTPFFISIHHKKIKIYTLIIIHLLAYLLSPLARAQLSDEFFDHKSILHISDELKHQLDTRVRPIHNHYKRAEKLHEFLFHEDQLNVVYDSRYTLNAHETFIEKRGNCLSLAALVTASARYVDLPAEFQSVNVKPHWEKSQQFYIVPGHINVAIELSNKALVFEFIAAYQETSRDRSNSTIIADERFYAEYYNNLGVDQMEKGNFKQAINLLTHSSKLYPDLSFTWSNLGVAYKLSNSRDNAEQSYRKAISLNKRNLSSLTNLYILLNEDNRTREANKMAKKVVRYSKKNPYYLAKLAGSDLKVKNYKRAQGYIKRAIKTHPEEPAFYHLLAQTYYMQGKKNKAINTMITASKVTDSETEHQRFQKKIHQMKANLLSKK